MSFQILFLLTFLVLISCKDPFEPELLDISTEVLVVEGYIEVEGESKIKLSRTVPVRNTEEVPAVKGARVSVTDNNNGRWDFDEKEGGVYIFVGNFSVFDTYRLNVELVDGTSYISEPLQPIISPEIEELDFLRDENGVEIFISTKGNEEAQYFLWSYEEHWIFRPGVLSSLIYENGAVRNRREEETINLCWNSNLFPKIILQNAARFEDNSILQRELVRIPNNSEKLTQRYSIEVKQKAINQEAFDFWDILRKNSDDIGGIFSPLPSLIRGNIYNLQDETEPVIGFISMGKSASKRIYIDLDDIFPWSVFIPEYEFCRVLSDTIPPNSAAISNAFSSGIRMPARDLFNQMGTLIGYLEAETVCTDCTLRGTNIKPEFWEEQ